MIIIYYNIFNSHNNLSADLTALQITASVADAKSSVTDVKSSITGATNQLFESTISSFS